MAVCCFVSYEVLMRSGWVCVEVLTYRNTEKGKGERVSPSTQKKERNSGKRSRMKDKNERAKSEKEREREMGRGKDEQFSTRGAWTGKTAKYNQSS